jgi:hypothetical protein
MTDKRAINLLCGAFVMCALLLTRIHGPKLFFIAEGDDLSYFAYARTLVMDRDFSFRNEPFPTFQTERANLQAARYAVGPGLLWVPFLALGHITARCISNGVAEADLSLGITPIHWLSASMSSVLYGLAGFLFLYLFLRRFFSPAVSTWSVLLAGFSSPLLYYLFRRPLMAHSAEFFSLSASAYAVSGLAPTAPRPRVVLAGLFTGLLFLCRWNDAPYVAAFLFWGLWNLRLSGTSVWRPNVRQVLFAGTAGLAACLQLVVWKTLTGSFYPGPAMFDLGIVKSSVLFAAFPWTLRHLADLFFGKDWGVFLLAPFLLLVVVLSLGHALGRPRLVPRLVLTLPAFFICWIAANWPSHGGEYGNRYLISIWILLGFLCAEVLDRLQAARWPRRIFLAAGAVSLLYSLTALSLFKSNSDTLTLHVGPTLYGLPSDWVNHDFARNAFHETVRRPASAAMTLGPSVAGYFIVKALGSAGLLPGAASESAARYFEKHTPPTPSSWAVFFVMLGGGVFFIWASARRAFGGRSSLRE